MEGLVEGDIVVISFPFSDLSSSKKKPALIIGKADKDDFILCQITSKEKDDSNRIALRAKDMEKGILHVESTIRPDKIFTADKQIILYKIGAVKKEKLEEVKNKLGEIFGGATRIEKKEITWQDLYKQQIAPLLTVDIIIRYKGGIVLVDRATEPFGWSIPGGFVEFGETVEQAAIREAKEETSLDITIDRQFHVYSDPKRDPRGTHSITVVIIVDGKGTLKAGDDAKEAQVFSLDKPLPKMPFDHNKILQDYMNEEFGDN